MNRVAAIFIAFMTLWGWEVSFAESLILEEGKHYIRAPQDVADNPLVKELAKAAPDDIYVLEFFSYGCAACYKLDPLIETWLHKLPAGIHFQRIPVEFHAEWRNLTKAYFTMLNLNAFDKIHHPLFEAIHSEKLTSASDDTLRVFFTEQGIPQKDFDQEFDSFTVNRKRKWAGAITRGYRVTAIPAFIVQGPRGIFVTTARLAGSQENVIYILNTLINLERPGSVDVNAPLEVPPAALAPEPPPPAASAPELPPPPKT
jgi:thiol:disulfide interchange protein DsbA